MPIDVPSHRLKSSRIKGLFHIRRSLTIHSISLPEFELGCCHQLCGVVEFGRNQRTILGKTIGDCRHIYLWWLLMSKSSAVEQAPHASPALWWHNSREREYRRRGFPTLLWINSRSTANNNVGRLLCTCVLVFAFHVPITCHQGQICLFPSPKHNIIYSY